MLKKSEKRSYYSPQIREKNFQFLRKSHGLTPLRKCKIFDFLNRCFLRFKRLDFYLQGRKKLCSGLFCWKTKKGQIFQFLTKNHGLTPFKKCKIFYFSNRCFLSLKWLDFYLQGHKTQSLLTYFSEKQKRTKFQSCDQNHGLTPLEKCHFSTFLNRCIFSLKWLDFFVQAHQTLCFGLFC